MINDKLLATDILYLDERFFLDRRLERFFIRLVLERERLTRPCRLRLRLRLRVRLPPCCCRRASAAAICCIGAFTVTSK
jgi:hypothetical protein